MRSDRNPYFFLKNSRDPKLQELFAQAETMTQGEINSLSIKPDWKKALLFLNSLGHQTKSATNAEVLADRMTAIPAPSAKTFEIWQYQGTGEWLLCNRTSIEIACGDYFLKDQEKIYCNNNWIDLNRNANVPVMQDSVFVEIGTAQTLSQKRSDALRQKYPTSLR